MTHHDQINTGVHDNYYNLVSVMYHALHGAQTYEKYARDAEESGDTELVQFFRQVQQNDSMRAQSAMQLLLNRGMRAQNQAAAAYSNQEAMPQSGTTR